MIRAMNTTVLRAGLSACGGISEVTLEAARNSPHFEIVAIQDPSAERMGQMGWRYRIERQHADFKDLLTDDIDFVILNGPNDVHIHQVAMAAAAGKHILVQKPMAPTLGLARYMVEEAAAHDVRLGVLMLDLGNPLHHQVKAMVEAGWFGSPTLIQSTSAHGIYLRLPPDPLDWRRDPTKVGGGAFIQLAIHALDLAQWLLDDRIEAVSAYGTRGKTVFQDETTLATVRFAGGTVGHFAASYATDHYGFVLCGTHGRIHLLDDHVVLCGRQSFEGEFFSYPSPGEEVVIPRDSMVDALAQRIGEVEIHDVFARWILGASDYPCPGERGVEDMRVVDAAYRSIEEGRWIDLA
jgi:predicted dehydrogenase